MAVHVGNASTLQVETGETRVQGHPWLLQAQSQPELHEMVFKK